MKTQESLCFLTNNCIIIALYGQTDTAGKVNQTAYTHSSYTPWGPKKENIFFKKKGESEQLRMN